MYKSSLKTIFILEFIISSKDTLEEKSINLDNIEDLFGEDIKTTEEFEIPHYKFDENGIIIN